MFKSNLIKSGIAIVCLVVVSLFGFSAAYGYGGGGGGVINPTPCTSVTYADWQGCVMGLQYRNVTSQTPANCVLTASQQAARVQSCASTPACASVTYGAWSTKCVLGVYTRDITAQSPAGCKITAAQELARAKTCTGGTVLGVKIYGEGQLIRAFGDVKIYVIKNGMKKHILDIPELAKYYFGLVIYNIPYDQVQQYPNY